MEALAAGSAILRLALAGLATVAALAPVSADTPEPRADIAFALPSLPLDIALSRFSSASGINILYDHGLANDRRSSALLGHFSGPQAMLLLLRGTGLVARFTSPKAAILVRGDEAATASAASPSAGAAGPSYVLQALHVTASSLIGGPNPAFETYARRMQGELSMRLTSAKAASLEPFRIDVRVHLDADGTVRDLALIAGTGDDMLDKRIVSLIEGTRISQPPPAGLPQPLRFRITSR